MCVAWSSRMMRAMLLLAGSLAHHLDVHALPSEHAEDALQDFARLVDVADEREDGVAACIARLGHALG